MSFIPVLQYLTGLGVVGFTMWVLNGIMDEFTALNIHVTASVYTLMDFLWAGVILIYLLFGGIWLIRKYNEEEYMRGRM